MRRPAAVRAASAGEIEQLSVLCPLGMGVTLVARAAQPTAAQRRMAHRGGMAADEAA